MKKFALARRTRWTLDLPQSELSFQVKEPIAGAVTGYFRDFSVAAETEGEDFSKPSAVELVIEVDSIHTDSDQRDKDLRSQDFFHAAKYSCIIFKGRWYERRQKSGKLYGELTIKETTKIVVLTVSSEGIAADAVGRVKASFAVSGKISRKKFGLQWNGLKETGWITADDKVKIHAKILLIRQQ